MYNFFAKKEDLQGDIFILGESDCNHIRQVLRMKEGATFLVSCEGKSHLCELAGFAEKTALARILEEDVQDTELDTKLILFQGLPKSDKLEWIIQKATELGAAEIVPVEMSRCVVKLEEKKKETKQKRWQAIAESAAKQSKRNLIPAVSLPLSFKTALKEAGKADLFLVPYENEAGMAGTKETLAAIKKGMRVAILIGPEGGFSEEEIAAAKEAGGNAISLGRRILRTETAALAALTACMLAAETNCI